jgi:septum formation inhibitor MinC
MCYGVTLAKARPYRSYVQYRFPMMLLRLSRSKEARGVKSAVAHKIGTECHSSMKDTIEQILPYFRELFKQNQEFRSSMALRLALEQEEIAFILEQKVDAPAVKQLMAEMHMVRERGRSAPSVERIDEPEPATKPERKGRKKKVETTPAPKVEEAPPPAPKEEKPSEADKGTQRTLFQF